MIPNVAPQEKEVAPAVDKEAGVVTKAKVVVLVARAVERPGVVMDGVDKIQVKKLVTIPEPVINGATDAVVASVCVEEKRVLVSRGVDVSAEDCSPRGEAEK